MPTEALAAPSSTRYDEETGYGGFSKTTAASGTTSHDEKSHINKTASLSFSSGEEEVSRRSGHDNDNDNDDDGSTRFTQSVYTQSVATPSLNGYSTAFTTDEGTTTSHSVLTGTTSAISMFGMDDDEISAILDAGDSEDDSNSATWTNSVSKSASYGSKLSRRSRGGSTTTGSRYYSETSGSYSADEDEDSDGSSGSFGSHGSSSSCSSRGSSCDDDDDDDDDETWEDIPECGTLVNVKPKINERVARLTPDHTSHLLRSRFRKKHFPRGSFPYDK
jgi:penicillin-binding protein 1A